MAITSSAGDGVRVTTAAKNGTVKSFTGGKVRLEDPIGTANNGNLMASPTYVGRLIWIYSGTGAGQVRYINGQTTGVGDGDDVDLDVVETWVPAPDNTSLYRIFYIIEDAATLTGLTLVSKTQVYESARHFTVGNTAGTPGDGLACFFLDGNKAFEWDDQASTTVAGFTVDVDGRYEHGINLGGAPVKGGYCSSVQNTTGELAMDVKDGGITNLYDFNLRCARANTTIKFAGGDHVWNRGKIFSGSEGMELAGNMTIEDFVIEGLGTTTDTVQIETTVGIQSITMTNMNGFRSLDDAVTESILVSNCTFVGSVSRHVHIHNNKTWKFSNPVGWVPNAVSVSFENGTSNECQLQFSLTIFASEPDGAVIDGANCYLYEGLLNQDIPADTRVDTGWQGTAQTDVVIDRYTFPASVFTTETKGDYVLKVYFWLKSPFINALIPDFSRINGVEASAVLNVNPNIVETTQATALTAGSSITWEKPTNPTQLLSYDTGTIAFVAGDVVTGGTSGALGTVTEVSEGTTATGKIHLRVRNATAFIAGEDLEVSATKNAQAVDPLVVLDFAAHIDGAGVSLQGNYDYHAAVQATDTADADMLEMMIWGGAEHVELVFAGGADSFFTERNVTNTEGIFISDRGVGTMSYMTADDGTQYIPPNVVSLAVTVKDENDVAVEGVQVYIQNAAGPFNDTSDLMRESTTVAGEASEPFEYTVPVAVVVRARKVGFLPDDTNQTITADGLSVQITLRVNPNSE